MDADPAVNTVFQRVHWRAGRYLATAVVSLFVSRSLPSNWSMRHNTMGTKNRHNGDLVEHTKTNLYPRKVAFSRWRTLKTFQTIMLSL
jgi:hypothetical protein